MDARGKHWEKRDFWIDCFGGGVIKNEQTLRDGKVKGTKSTEWADSAILAEFVYDIQGQSAFISHDLQPTSLAMSGMKMKPIAQNARNSANSVPE